MKINEGCPLWGQQMRHVLSATPPNLGIISGQAERISVAAKFIFPGLFEIISTGLLGAKGIGEGCMVNVASAISNAICHATGVRLTDLRMTPEAILQGLSKR